MLPTLLRNRGSIYTPQVYDFVNRFFNENLWDRETDETSWTPHAEVRETEKEIYIEAELPGIDKKDVKVEIKDNTLTLSGERTHKKVTEEGYYYRSERRYGAFERSFRLPDYVDSEHITAEHENGVLTLSIPKKEEAKPHTVKVK